MKLSKGLTFEFASTTNQDILSIDKILKKL
jgi:hypothetical protein